ncbi:MAG: hypothetical protein AAGF85_17275 [Bacteroidota bacterium]
MNRIAEIKVILHHYIAGTDDIHTLAKLEQYVKQLLAEEDKIIAYTAQGKPLDQAAYKKEIDEAIAEVDRGEVISQEEMEKDL